MQEYTSADSKNREFTGRQIEKRVSYVKRFELNDLWWSEDEIKNKGIQIISF